MLVEEDSTRLDSNRQHLRRPIDIFFTRKMQRQLLAIISFVVVVSSDYIA